MARLTPILIALVLIAPAATACRRESPATTTTTATKTANNAALARGGSLVASVRSEPTSYNRYVPAGVSAATDFLTLLTHARLVRVNRVTDDLEPWLAEKWTQSPDGLAYTLTLRPGVAFSDGAPFTSADVLFSFRAAYDPDLHSPLREGLLVQGKPLDVTAPDPLTVIIRFPGPFAPGLRLLDNMPILPRHKLEAALNARRLDDEWTPAKPLTDIAGLGPFVLAEHVSGQRLVLNRNPHFFRRDASGVQLPYLDTLTLAIVPDQSAESLRLQAGEIDLMANGDVRPQDYSGFKALADKGAVRLVSAGVGLDPDFLWFNLTGARQKVSSAPWLFDRGFRQALSYAVDRQAIVNSIYLGAAVPIYGPVSPGNTRWYSPSAPAYPFDQAKARQLLASAGLADRNGDGILDDRSGRPVRFSVLTQSGHIRGRAAEVIQAQLRQVGVAVDLVTLDPNGIFRRWEKADYDAIYFGLQASSTDPALNLDFWLSSGTGHFWNPSQKAPSHDWEKRIDELMREQMSAPDLASRQRAFAEVQRIMGEELPAIYFVTPKITIATSMRVRNATPAPQAPQLLWSPDTLASADAGRSR
jgi:peptide/nickel transport system substrate-binding protein